MIEAGIYPDDVLVVKALEHAWEQRGQPEKVMFQSPGESVC